MTELRTARTPAELSDPTDGPLESADVSQSRPQPEQGFGANADLQQAQGYSVPIEGCKHASRLSPSPAVETIADGRRDYSHPSQPRQQENASEGAPTRQILPFRRVAEPKSARLRQHLDMAEQASGDASPSNKGSTSADSISAFLARLLDQLSLSAWLPAAMLVGSLAVLLQLRAQHNHNLVEAITSLVNRPLGLLVLLLFAIILATMVTQAFEFEVIRFLEGYWGNSVFARGIFYISVNRQRSKRDGLMRKRDKLELQAFQQAKKIIPSSKAFIVEVIEEELKAQVEDRPSVLPRGWRAKRRIREATSFNWQELAPAYLMGRLDAVENQIDEYPSTSRLMPTKLGNVLRAVEDSLPSAEGDKLERFVMDRWDETPGALQNQHDLYRSRLDLYCTLVFVFLVLAVLAPLIVTFGSGYLLSTVIVSLAYLIMSFVSYTAAVASGRGYGTALKAIAENDPSVSKTRHWTHDFIKHKRLHVRRRETQVASLGWPRSFLLRKRTNHYLVMLPTYWRGGRQLILVGAPRNGAAPRNLLTLPPAAYTAIDHVVSVSLRPESVNHGMGL
jgi:hypothetical protein